MRLDELVDLRARFIGDVREHRLSAMEKLLSTWVSAGHADHINEIRRVRGDGIPFECERYQCFKDGAVIDLWTDVTMNGGMMTLTVRA